MTSDHSLSLALSWCDEDRDLLGSPCRPLSLVSHHLLRLVRSRVMEMEPGYETQQGEVRDMTLFAWLHTADLDEVTEAMWTGAWRAVLEVAMRPEILAEALPEWREKRLRMASLCAAVDYEIAPPPLRESHGTSSAPQPPSNLMHSTRLAHRLRLLMLNTGVSREYALWEFPYWQAVQICHAAERYEGAWTVPPFARTPPAEFGGFDLPAEEEV